VHIRPAGESFVHNFVPGPDCGLVCPVLSSRARACRRDHQVPRVPLPDVGVTFIREPYTRLLRGHYSWFLTTTDSFANPMWLSLPSASGLVQGVLAGRHQPLLPPGLSRRYSANLSCDARAHTPAATAECTCLVLPQCHRPSPTWKGGSASRFCPRTRFFAGRFSRLQLFRYVQASQFARLTDRSHVCSFRRRAAEAFTSELNVRRYLRTHRICYPPDYRQLTERGLSPRKIHSIVGCSLHPASFPRP